MVSQTDIYKKGLKAYFKLIRSLNPPPTPAISLHLFDHLVKPILLYGCEIWSPIDLKYKSTINKQPMTNKTLFINQLRDNYPFITKHMDKIDPIEKLHLKFLKSILGVHSKATNLAVYGELGRYPLFIDSITRCMKYIQYIETETENKLLKQFYECLVDNQDLIKTCSLLTIEKQIKVHMNTRPVNQQCKSTGVFFKSLKKSLTSSFDNYWHEMLHNNESLSCKLGGNKLRTFRKFKHIISYEKYLNLKDVEKRRNITKLRTSEHKLRIETERFNNKNTYVPPELRLCMNCEGKQVEDEFHFIAECNKYTSLRDELFTKCKRYNKYFDDYNNYDKFIWLLSNENLGNLSGLGTFITEALKIRST